MEKAEKKQQIVHYDVSEYSIKNQKQFNGTPYIIIYRPKGNSTTELHWHPQTELWLITEGEGTLYLNDNPHRLKAGDIVCINGDIRHSMNFHDPNTMAYICIIIESMFMEGECGVPRSVFFDEQFTDSEIAELMRGIYDEFVENHRYSDIKIKASLMNIIVALTRRHVVTDAKDYDPKASSALLVKSIIEYIQANYQRQISLDDIAAANSVSKCYMCRIFKELTGDTVLYFINTLRCTYANYLMHTKSYSINEIAAKCGFGSASYFSRVYKKHTGIPPSMSRKS